MDFAMGLVNSVINLPDGQVKFFGDFKLQKNCEINLLIKTFWRLVEMIFGLVMLASACPKWQAVKVTFFAPWSGEVVVYERFQLKSFNWKNFGFSAKWWLIEGGYIWEVVTHGGLTVIKWSLNLVDLLSSGPRLTHPTNLSSPRGGWNLCWISRQWSVISQVLILPTLHCWMKPPQLLKPWLSAIGKPKKE